MACGTDVFSQHRRSQVYISCVVCALVITRTLFLFFLYFVVLLLFYLHLVRCVRCRASFNHVCIYLFIWTGCVTAGQITKQNATARFRWISGRVYNVRAVPCVRWFVGLQTNRMTWHILRHPYAFHLLSPSSLHMRRYHDWSILCMYAAVCNDQSNETPLFSSSRTKTNHFSVIVLLCRFGGSIHMPINDIRWLESDMRAASH